MFALLMAVLPAAAQVEACPGPLPLGEWVDAMDAVDEALAALEGTRADRILDEIVYEMRCLRTAVPPEKLGRLAQQVSVVAFYQQDVEEMRYWSLLARETLGPLQPEDAPLVPDRYFELVAAIPVPTEGHAEGSLLVPKGGGALLDGFLLREPAATLGVQHLFQLADHKGRIESTSWQTGAAFGEEFRSEDEGPLSVPRWYRAPDRPPMADAVEIEPVEPEPVEPEPVEPEPVEPEPVEPEPVEPVPVVDTRPRRMPAFDGDGRALDCPWKFEPHNIEATRARVRINRHVYTVKTAAEQAVFKGVLNSCGEYRAARRFARWRVASGKLFSGARSYREAMVQALLTPEPRRVTGEPEPELDRGPHERR